MSDRPCSDFSISAALELYQRLRQRGQTSILARLSVEARCGDLPLQERLRVRQILRQYETQNAA
jgi:hypothetical protein